MDDILGNTTIWRGFGMHSSMIIFGCWFFKNGVDIILEI
jgi:hypothetical protein